MTSAANGRAGWEGGDVPEPEDPGRRRKKWIVTLSILAAVILVAGCGIGIYLYNFSKDDGLIFDNVYAFDINLGGMTTEEAKDAVHQATDAVYPQSLTVELQDRSLVLKPEDTKAKLDVDGLVEAAYNHGREGNMFQRAKARAQAKLTDYHMETLDYLQLDTAFIQDAVNQLGSEIASTLAQPTISVEGERPDLEPYQLPDEQEEEGPDATEPTEPIVIEGGQVMTVTVGSPERSLDTEALYKRILSAYTAADLSPIQTTYEEELPEAPDLKGTFDQYCLAPVDSVLNEDTYVASKESVGYGFDLEAVQKQIEEAEPGTELKIEFQVLIPKVTKASLEADLFKDALASVQTNHTSNSNRTNNLRLACEAIDGLILKPGDVFSFNDTVGERTAAKGYKEATVYSGMQSVQELGGGVCQVASTLYYATLLADLEIVERRVHTFKVDYVPYGMDATVYWGSLDYRFKNNTDYPIRIDASVHDGVVDIEFVGTETKDYYVKMTYDILDTYSWETEYKEITDGSYADGEVIQSAYTGYKVKSYKSKYDRQTDELISTEFEADSSYSKRNKVVAVVPRPTTPPTEAPTDPPTDPPNPDAVG